MDVTVVTKKKKIYIYFFKCLDFLDRFYFHRKCCYAVVNFLIMCSFIYISDYFEEINFNV